MTENAGIARLWQGFHHLAENDKDLVLAVAETVGRLAEDAPQFVLAAPGDRCYDFPPGEQRAFVADTAGPLLAGLRPAAFTVGQ